MTMTKEEVENLKLERLIKKLVSNARAILTNQIGLALGVQKMTGLLLWVKDLNQLDINVQIFNEYYSRTTGIPLGTERLQWNIESLIREDQKLQKLDELYKDDILRKCEELIKKYGKTSNE